VTTECKEEPASTSKEKPGANPGGSSKRPTETKSDCGTSHGCGAAPAVEEFVISMDDCPNEKIVIDTDETPQVEPDTASSDQPNLIIAALLKERNDLDTRFDEIMQEVGTLSSQQTDAMLSQHRTPLDFRALEHLSSRTKVLLDKSRTILRQLGPLLKRIGDINQERVRNETQIIRVHFEDLFRELDKLSNVITIRRANRTTHSTTSQSPAPDPARRRRT
jgi:hypothetical protein